MLRLTWVLGRWVGVLGVCVGLWLAVGEVWPVGADPGAAAATPSAPTALQEKLEKLRDKYKISSISLAVMKGGEVKAAVAVGVADAGTKTAAKANTIYLMASCSKPVVGLAVAKLMELQPGFDLDADVNTYLKWPTPLEHPDFPDKKITMRQLMQHKSGVGRDAPIEYEDYPKPDPDQSLDAFLQAQIMGDEASDDAWLETAPGEVYEYSNLGAALAALVVEKASGKDFAAFCEEHLFQPLKMADTHWRFKEFSKEQQARIARPYAEDGEAYEQFGFNDYPSGLLRTSMSDFMRLWGAVAKGGEAGGVRILSAESVKRFESVPMFIGSEDGAFSHDGSEHGTNTYFVYRKDGSGYAVAINSDLEDGSLDTLSGEIDALVDEALRGL